MEKLVTEQTAVTAICIHTEKVKKEEEIEGEEGN